MSEYESAALAVSQTQVWVTAGVGLLQCALIGWGLWRMGVASKERNRQLDQQGEVLAGVGQALARQGEVLGELLRREQPPA